MSKMTGTLVLPKDQEIVQPSRIADHVSHRGVLYWWAPDWVRYSPGKKSAFGRVLPVRLKANESVFLHSLSQSGNLTLIKGRIQHAFQVWYILNKDVKVWNEDMSFDCLILDEDPRDVLEINWDMKKK